MVSLGHNILSYFVVNMVDIGSSNSLSFRHQAITWTNAELLLIRPSRTYINQFLFAILMFSSKKMHLKMGPYITRTSAATVLNMQDYKKIEKNKSLSSRITSAIPVLCNDKKCKYIISKFPKINLAWQELPHQMYSASFTWEQFLKKCSPTCVHRSHF